MNQLILFFNSYWQKNKEQATGRDYTEIIQVMTTVYYTQYAKLVPKLKANSDE